MQMKQVDEMGGFTLKGYNTYQDKPEQDAKNWVTFEQTTLTDQTNK